MNKRLNLLAILVILLGGLSLTTTSALAGSYGDECETNSGATCTGTPCCVVLDNCYTGQEMCNWVLCQGFPEHPDCPVT
jgi:hypothetical protein